MFKNLFIPIIFYVLNQYILVLKSGFFWMLTTAQQNIFLKQGLTGAEQNLNLLTWSECCLIGPSRCCDEKMFSLTYQMKGKFIDLSTTYYPIYLYLTRCEYSFQPNCLITTYDTLSAFGFDNKKREQRVWPKCQKIQTFENRIVPELWVCLHWPKIEKVMEKDYQCAQHDGYFRSEERRVGKECRSRWSPYP